MSANTDRVKLTLKDDNLEILQKVESGTFCLGFAMLILIMFKGGLVRKRLETSNKET